MGEDEEGLITSTASLQALIQKLTSKNGQGGVNILEPDNKTFKSTYQIMKEISEVWNNMNDTSQSALLQAIAGKSRANGVAALLSNFEQAEAALKTSQESAGSAMAENEKYLDSISGKLALLTNQWDEMWTNAVNSEFAKFILDISNGALQAVNHFGLLGTTLSTIAGLLFSLNGFKLGESFESIKTFVVSLKDVKGRVNDVKSLFGSLRYVFSSDNTKASVLDKLDEVFKNKGLDGLKDYVKNQNDLTKAFKAQILACEDNEAAGKALQAERNTESAITTGLIAKEVALKAVRAAAVAGIGLAISAVIKYAMAQKQAREEAMQAAIDEGKTQAERFKAIQEAYEEYNSLKNASGKVVASDEKLAEITSKINEAFGERAKALDNVSGRSQAYIDKLNEIYEKEQAVAKSKAADAYRSAKDEVKHNKKIDTQEDQYVYLPTEFSQAAEEHGYHKGTRLNIDMSNPIHALEQNLAITKDIEDANAKIVERQDEILDLEGQIAIIKEQNNGKSTKESKELESRVKLLNAEIKSDEHLIDTVSAFRSQRSERLDAYSQSIKDMFSTSYNPKSGADLRSNLGDFTNKNKDFKDHADLVKELVGSIYPEFLAEMNLVDEAVEKFGDRVTDGSLTVENLEEAISNGDVSINDLSQALSEGFDDSKIVSTANSLDELIDSINKAVGAYNDVQAASMSFSDILTTQKEAIDDVQKNISTISDLYGKALSPETLSAGDTIDLLQEMNEAFTTMGEDFDISGVDDLNDLDDVLLKLIDDGGWLDKALEDLNISDDLKNQIKQMADEEIRYKNAIQDATQDMSGLSSSYQTIRGAMDEYSKSGQLTYSTLSSLLQLEPEYLALLQVENGQLGINTDALTAMVEQQKLEAINATFAAEAETLNAMAQAQSAQQAANSATAHAALQEVLLTTAGCYDSITSSALSAAAAEAQAAAANALDAGVDPADIKRVQESFQQMRQDIVKMDVSTKKGADKALGYAKKAGGGAQKTAKEALDKILAELKNAVEDGAITTKDYLDQMKKLTDQYYKEGKISLKEYMEYQRQYYRGVVDMYKEVAAAVQRYFDKQKEGLNDQKEGLQDQIDALQEQQDAQDRVYDKQIKALEKEKTALEKKKDKFERTYNKEIEKIEKKQHKLEEQIKVYEKEKQAIEDIQKAIERQVDELEDQQKIYQQMQKDLERQKQPYEDQKSALEKIIKGIERQQKEIEKQKKVYEDQVKVLERTKRVLERQTEELERQKKPLEAQKKYYEKQVKELEKQEKVLDKQVDALQKQQKEIEKQKELLEESKKPYQDQLDILNEQKEALEKANQARQEAINLQKAQYALEQAHEQRTNLILKNGQFIYEADQSAVRDAQDGLRDAQYQKKLKGIDGQIDFNNGKIKDIDKAIKPLTEKNDELQKSIDSIQDSIDALKEKMESWKERSEIVQESIDAIDEKISEIKDSIETLDNQIEDINYNYIQPLEDQNDKLSDQITELNYQIADIDVEIEKFEEQIRSLDRNIDDLDAQIEKLNAETERYNELLEPIEDKIEALTRKNEKYGEKLDDIKYKLEQITKKIDKQIDKIDRKIDKINEEKDAFDEAIEDQIYELQKQEKQIDKQITQIDRYARQWQRVIDEWQLAKDQKLLEGMFGGNWKERLDSLDPSLIQEFAAGFRQACEDMRKNAEEAAKSIQTLQDAVGGSGGSGGGSGSSSTLGNKNPYGLTHRGGNGDPKQAALDIDEVDSSGLDSFLTKANKDVPKAKDTAKAAMKETNDSAKSSNSILDKFITAHAAAQDTSKRTESELVKNSNSIKNSINNASKTVSSSSAEITSKSSDASKTVNENVSKIIGDASKAQTDSDSKASLVSSKWTGLQGLVNTQTLGIAASGTLAENKTNASSQKITSFMDIAKRNTEKAESEIQKSGSKAQTETNNFMTKVKSEVKKGTDDAKRGADDIKKHGAKAESDTKSSMSKIKTEYNGAEKNSSTSANNIKKTGEDAQRVSKEHTSSIKQAWDDLKEKVKSIWESISSWLSDMMSKIGDANNAASNVKAPSGGSGGTNVPTYANGGRVRIPVAAKGRRIKLEDNLSANLNAVAHAVGEDVMVAAKEGEGIFTKQQTDDLEELIELTPELINSTKEYSRFANLFKSLTVNPSTVQDNIVHSLNGTTKGVNSNVVNSQTNKTISMQIGDVIVQGVENVNDFAAKIKSNLPNAMLQELMATT